MKMGKKRHSEVMEERDYLGCICTNAKSRTCSEPFSLLDDVLWSIGEKMKIVWVWGKDEKKYATKTATVFYTNF